MTLIRNADLYAPEHVGIRDILTGGGRILHIDKRIATDLPVAIIDAQGGIVHPGFIDGHVHATGGGGEAGMLSRVPPLSESEIALAAVTSLVGVLGTDGATRTVRDLVAKVRGYREWGLSAWCLTGSYEVPSQTLTGSVRDDIVFIDEVIGVKVAISDHRCSLPGTAELIHLASEARIAGLISAKCGIVHIHVGTYRTGIEQLFEIADTTPLPLSVFYPTHMGGHMDMARRWLERGGHVDLTCGAECASKAADLLSAHPDAVTLSTDSNGSFPKWNEAKEIVGMDRGRIAELDRTVSELISLGLDRALAYKAVTENPAKWMRLCAKGRLDVGKDADLVIRDGERIRTVIARGERLVDEGRVRKSMYE